jgi:hypothetical protein
MFQNDHLAESVDRISGDGARPPQNGPQNDLSHVLYILSQLPFMRYTPWQNRLPSTQSQDSFQPLSDKEH